MPDETKKRAYAHRDELRRHVLANHFLPGDEQLTPREIAKEHGCTPATVHQIIHRLRQKGILPPTDHHDGMANESLGDATNTHATAQPSAAAMNTHQMLQDVLAGAIIDKSQRRHVLSIIVALGSNTEKMTAMKVLNDMDAQEAVQVGLPPPDTAESATQRLLDMLSAAPESVANAAVAQYQAQIAQENPKTD